MKHAWLPTLLVLCAAADAAPRFELRLDDGLLARQLRYRDDLEGALRDYDLVGNAIALRGSARLLRSLPAFQLIASGELLAGMVGSVGPDGLVYRTHASELQLGGRYSVRIGHARIAVSVSAGQHRFSVDDRMSELGPLVPATRYRFARWGASADVRVHRRATLTSSLGYRELASVGEVGTASWFPRMTGAGIDMRIGLDWSLAPGLRAYADAQLRRYFFAMNPAVGDSLIVGGAIDQYISAVAGIAISIR